MNIIDKILNVKQKNTSRLQEGDTVYLDTLQADFQKVWADLDIWEMVFNSKLQERFKGYYTTSNYSGYPSHTIDTGDMPGEFCKHYFLPTDALDKINEQRKELLDDYSEKIIEYFNDQYSLELSFSRYRSEIKDFYDQHHYTPVIDWLFTKIEGASLVGVASQKLIESFNAEMQKIKLTINKNTVTFNRLSPSWGWGKINMENDGARTIFGAFSLFDKGEYGSYMTGDLPIETYTEYQKVYSLHGEKITGIKIFQNGKAILYFVDPPAAADFISYFNINL